MEVFAVKIEDGPSAVVPMKLFDDTAYAFRAMVTAAEDEHSGSICAGVNAVCGYGGFEVGHLELYVWGWSKLVEYLKSKGSDQVVEDIHDTGEHEFDTKAEGIDFVDGIKNSMDGWGPFITPNDELNLIVRV